MKKGPEYHRSAEKRSFDLSVAIGTLPVASLITLAMACYLRRDIAPETAILRQLRLADDSRSINLFKLRTLTGCDDKPLELKGAVDPRAGTRANRVRRLGLDELPELFLVLEGSMSVVGHRPLLPEEHSKYRAADYKLYDDLWLPMARQEKPGLISASGIYRRKMNTPSDNQRVKSMELDVASGARASLLTDAYTLATCLRELRKATTNSDTEI